MNRIASLSIAASLVTLFALPSMGQDIMGRDTMLTGAQWDSFNKSLIEAVHSDHAGRREGALGQIAMYGAYMDWPELTIIDVVRISRNNQDPQVRRLAIVAAANMGSDWAIEYYDMLSRFEENEAVKSTMEAVVRRHRAAKEEM